ncbi:hypothetical protein AMELA_G00020400 [Ameiurus melas]|uniref:Gelsolin-like domain-containing protein n=1 Tax=Ameiurus melas TaxID=219545 RepID=A0A7J6BBG2_AMEME|nr:hypothetical protein AMELA_G00020400 [Ameiurus melas]
MYLWLGRNCNEVFIRDVLGCPDYASIPASLTVIPELETAASERTRAFVSWLQESRGFCAAFYVLKDDLSRVVAWSRTVLNPPSPTTSSCSTSSNSCPNRTEPGLVNTVDLVRRDAAPPSRHVTNLSHLPLASHSLWCLKWGWG